MALHSWTLSRLPERLRFWEPPNTEPETNAMAERIRARYIQNCKKRESTRVAMRECGVLDDWKEAWDRS